MVAGDDEFMNLALAEARGSSAEDGLVHPKVGVAVARDGTLLASAHRGELGPGDHAEFTALERKMKNDVAVGSTVYTTLEPCTARTHPKVPCADRLVERGIARVVIGMLDPDERIRGIGIERLRAAGVEISFFDNPQMAQVEELNRDYIRLKQSSDLVAVDADFVAANLGRSLDEWYRVLNVMYWSKNANRDPSQLFAHLVEVIGGVSTLASSKKKAGVIPETHLAKAFAWWLSLCGSVGVQSPERMVAEKFPRVCPYCLKSPHDPDECLEAKRQNPGPRWDDLARIGSEITRPGRLGDWQVMFATIYPVQQTEDYGLTFARLAEELGELAEAVRVFRHQPGYFRSEASDVFAWLMRIQNLLDIKSGQSFRDRGATLEATFAAAYPDACRDCGKRVCSCPEVLPSTIGRIGHEDPAVGGRGEHGRFMSPDERRRTFSPG